MAATLAATFGEAPPCDHCGTTGGYRRRGSRGPSRYEVGPHLLCHACRYPNAGTRWRPERKTLRGQTFGSDFELECVAYYQQGRTLGRMHGAYRCHAAVAWQRLSPREAAAEILVRCRPRRTAGDLNSLTARYVRRRATA